LDRRRRRAQVLGLGVALAATAALASDAAPPLRAMLWAPKGADPVRAVATAPPECVRAHGDAYAVELGRAAFGSPLLLGGQAARAGLSCESCHRAGRDNPDFQFPGLSGAPGTADVTASLFSSHRGNGVHDPKPIPDLGGPRSGLKVKPGDLEAFIRGLIVEEFDGPQPPRAVLAGVAAYVRSLDPAACPAERTPVTAHGYFQDALRAKNVASDALSRGDLATAEVMVGAARARLGLIHERFAGQRKAQARLRQADDALAQVRARMRQAPEAAILDLAEWENLLRRVEADVRRDEPRSLFDPGRLSQAAKRRLPAKSS
jgi:hypothetical protein